MVEIEPGIYFVYDGACPLCAATAQALRIQREFGKLHLINARDVRDHSVMDLILERQLDLDQGMVIYVNNRFYHGKEALNFMAKYAEPENLMMTICKTLFWSKSIAAAAYPVLKSIRNWILRIKGIPQLHSLSKRKK